MDDGIELNFASPSSGTGSAVRKLKARKVSRRIDIVVPDRSEPGTPVVSPLAIPQSQPQSRQARPSSRPTTTNGSRKVASDPQVSSHAPIVHRPQFDHLASPDAGPSRQTAAAFRPVPAPSGRQPRTPQIISSLFTSNSVASVPKQSASGAQTRIGAPSNAPLGDTSTFSGLGLDALLVRHLKGKMKVDRPTGIQRSALPYLLSEPLDIASKLDDEEEAGTPRESGLLRDVFIQSQTGSGKTLSYLLPIIQTLLPLSRLSYIDRSIGTLAVILAPTRELAQQISKVLEQLLSMSLASEDGNEQQLTRWLVSGLLTGGSTKTHEKARLRKGVPILVSTPGRLLDHLQNTSSFQCAKTLFLVLDEADRLMDLGFEETITGIIKALDGRRKLEIAAEKEMNEEGGGNMRWPFWSRGRHAILCSATADAKVVRLAGAALRDPVTFRADTGDVLDSSGKRDGAVKAAIQDANTVVLPAMGEDKFTPPSQLAQKYVVTPTKLRLVALVSLLRALVAQSAKSAQGTKIIVFLSSTDAVDYHWKLLGGVRMGEGTDTSSDNQISFKVDGDTNGAAELEDEERKPIVDKSKKTRSAEELVTLSSPLFPNTTLHRLHGSLPLRTRQSSLAKFSTSTDNASILLATSVASRGLDLPLVRAVVQYDLPTEGGANEYVHRVGRTARAGKGGEAWAFVSPGEVDWVGWVEGKMGRVEGGGGRLVQVGVEDVLKRGFGGKGYEYEGRATEVQLAFERWVLAQDQHAALARKAFSSYVRAYSTHPLEEKKYFHPKSLHLGHLAKAFALREAPGTMSSSSSSAKPNLSQAQGQKRKWEAIDAGSEDGELVPAKQGKEATARNETERRMYEAVRKQGRAVKSGGALGEFAGARQNGRKGGGGGGGEYQVMDVGELERMVSGKFGR